VTDCLHKEQAFDSVCVIISYGFTANGDRGAGKNWKWEHTHWWRRGARFGGTAGDLLSLRNVGSVLLCIDPVPYILPFNAWVRPIFGWVRLNRAYRNPPQKYRNPSTNWGEIHNPVWRSAWISYGNGVHLISRWISILTRGIRYLSTRFFWLAACYSVPFHWSVICVITNDSRHFIVTNNGLLQARNEPFTFSVSLWFEFCSASVTVN